MSVSNDTKIDPRALVAGQRIQHRSGTVSILRERKADDSGWWLVEHGGLADRAWDLGEWTALDEAKEAPARSLSRVGAGIEEIGRKASLESATARRYSDLNGGGDDPQGELWSHLAHLADLVSQLAAWIIEDDE